MPVGAAATFASWVPEATSVELPWQVLQVRLAVSIAPFTCLPPETRMAPVASTVPEWHRLQVVTAAALW